MKSCIQILILLVATTCFSQGVKQQAYTTNNVANADAHVQALIDASTASIGSGFLGTNDSRVIILSSQSNLLSGTFSGGLEGNATALADTNTLVGILGGNVARFTNAVSGGYYATNMSGANRFLLSKVGSVWTIHETSGGITDGTNFSGFAQGRYLSPAASTRAFLRYADINVSSNMTNIANSAIAAAGVVTTNNYPVSRIVTNAYYLKDFGTAGADFEVFNHALAVTNNTTINVGWAHFTQAHSNAMAVILGADTNRGNFITTITAVNNSTQVVVAAAVPFSYNYQYPDTNIQKFSLGYPMVVITNSSHLAMQGFVNQRTNGLNGIWDMGAGYYALTNAPQFTNQNNCQIIIPSPSLTARTNDINNAPVFILQGAGPIAPGFYSSSGEFSVPKNATVIFSTWKGNGWKGTNRMAFSVFNFTPFDGTAAGYNRSDASLAINAVKPIMKNFWLYQEYDPDGVGINAQGTFEPELHDVLIGCFLYPWFCPEPRHTNGWAYLGAGDYCGNGATSTHCQMWGYNSLIDLGIGNFDDFTLGIAHNAFTSVIGGSTAENWIRNVQFTCIPKWIAGSGPIASSTNDATFGMLPTFLSSTPKVTVNSYQTQILPGATPQWMSVAPAPYYDSSNYVGNSSVGARASWIEYPNLSQAGLGAVPVQSGGTGSRAGNPGQWLTMNAFALPYQGSTNTDSRDKIWTGSQSFAGPVIFTNAVTFTNGVVSMNGGDNKLQLNGYLNISATTGLVMPSGTGGDPVFGNITSGNTKWKFGVRNAGDLIDATVGDFWFQSQVNGVNTTPGINNLDGRSIVLSTNGAINVVGGFASYNTNTLTFTTVSSCTNTLGWDATATISAGTSVVLQDRNGNTIDTIGTVATLHVLVPMRQGMRLSGTGITCVIY